MKTSVIGFPRIGENRELKFASEKYFAGKITAKELEKTAAELRRNTWLLQKNAGIDFISSNDFSFYDNMLDTSLMLGVIPKRYRNLCLSKLDTCFAMARGFQTEKSDVTALPMKKWFNTNYHYIVPEFDDSVSIQLDDSKAEQEYREASGCGVQTKPDVIGPYTFLKLSSYAEKKQASDFADDAAKAYRQLLSNAAKWGAEWIQIDEPALVLDMTEKDKVLFTKLYKTFLWSSPLIKSFTSKYQLIGAGKS